MATKEFTNVTSFGMMTKFEAVQESGQIPLSQFLQAGAELVCILEDLGSAFSMPKKDMAENVKRIQERQKSDSEKYTTINSILEEDAKPSSKKQSRTVVSVLWLSRGLNFIRAFLDGLCKSYHDDSVGEGDLRSTIMTAYENSLKPFHGRMLQFVFSNVVTHFLPSRSNFLKSLSKGPNATFDEVISDIELFLPNLTANVDLLESLLNQYDVNSSDKA